jgi:hypothetical protein
VASEEAEKRPRERRGLGVSLLPVAAVSMWRTPLRIAAVGEDGADTRRDQEWATQPCADRVTRSVTGWRKPMPAVRPPFSRIISNIGIRLSQISAARDIK